MNYHIIKAGESIKMIAKNYELLEDEIIKNNKHITNWDKLIPGTRLKLPNISEKLADEIDEVEPFIEDYYPKQLFDLPKENDSNSSVTEEVVLEKEESLMGLSTHFLSISKKA